jgi:hypothetical protein
MTFTTAQYQTIKAAIAAETDPTFVGYRTAGATGAMAEWYSGLSSPAFIAWRTNVSLPEVVAEVDGVELVGLTAIKLEAYQSLLLAGYVNPSKTRIRAGFDQVFSAAGGTITRPLLLALWKRTATRVEKLFATGTGSDASPATLVYEGGMTDAELVRALNS